MRFGLRQFKCTAVTIYNTMNLPTLVCLLTYFSIVRNTNCLVVYLGVKNKSLNNRMCQPFRSTVDRSTDLPRRRRAFDEYSTRGAGVCKFDAKLLAYIARVFGWST